MPTANSDIYIVRRRKKQSSKSADSLALVLSELREHCVRLAAGRKATKYTAVLADHDELVHDFDLKWKATITTRCCDFMTSFLTSQL